MSGPRVSMKTSWLLLSPAVSDAVIWWAPSPVTGTWPPGGTGWTAEPSRLKASPGGR